MLKIDVVLPFHRVDSFLLDAIQSLLRSQDVVVHILAIDDRVDRDSPLHLSFPEVEILVNMGTGYLAALKTGIDASTQDYVAFANSDDLVHPHRFIKQANALIKDNSDLAISRILKFRKGHSVPARLGEIGTFSYKWHSLLLGAYGADATWLARASWLKAITFPNYSSVLGDWLLAANIFPNSHVTLVDEYLYYYRQHSFQSSKNHSLSGSNFQLITQSWRSLNEKARLPPLTDREIMFVAFPTLSPQQLGEEQVDISIDIARVLEWADCLEFAFESSKEIRWVRRMIDRRLLGDVFSNPNHFNGKHALHYFSGCNSIIAADVATFFRFNTIDLRRQVRDAYNFVY